ncbi:dynamin family protein [Calothrix sp. UHCC 0171]|uniref:dynamin family protein n=1 Tax=Calothrix sp. UHCC 0171 TaxID=3110245 RepID=UPI002B218FA4|nr:dynamin family protein [Calothrix sp. UHCC 0171]MEA5572805.1 dynamin family protein [Calothrix sp. UHCC 0171]
MNINLRGAREGAGLSQSELAIILGISQTQVSRYEQYPGAIPAELLLRWAQALGTDIQTLMASAIPLSPPIDAGDPYLQLRRDLHLVEQYVTNSYPDGELNIPYKPPTANDIIQRIHHYRQKPNLVLVGRFDSGKSHLANTLMGAKILPSQYQPATRVITFVRHISDRPSWFKEQVGILAEDFWTRDEKGNQVFDLNLLDSQLWLERHSIKLGSLEVLREHGVHNHLSEIEIEGHSAVVYVDSPILKSCNIVDFPGYSDQADQTSEDVKKANSAVQIADLILYTSPINGFMNAEDFSRLSYLLRVLPSPETHNQEFPILGNLFIVGTHANPSISDLDISSILQTGSIRFYKHIEETVLIERSKRISRPIKKESLQRRFFAFWEETPRRWESLRKELIKILGESLPKARINRIDREIDLLQNQATRRISEQIRADEESETEQRQPELEELDKEETERLAAREQGYRKCQNYALELRDKTKNSFKQAYTSLIDICIIQKLICDRYQDKKEAQEYIAVYLNEQLGSKLTHYVIENAEFFKIEVEKFLDTYEEALLKLPKLNLGSVCIPFDTKGAFIGGIAGSGSVGALAVWAASLGNLGAYILVAKFVSLLSALGISISGGVATVVSFVAAIGGPITLGIGLLAAVFSLGLALFGESWERRLAKKIVGHFEEQKVLDKFLQASDEYWQDTAKAFEKGANAVEEEFQEYIQHLRELCSNEEASREKVENILLLLRKFKTFFAEIPWRGL